MIIWQGMGIIVPLIAIFVLIVTQMVTDGILGSSYYENHWWMHVVALALSAALMYFFALKVIQTKKDKVVIDKETGKDIILKQQDTLFFVHIRHWWKIFIGICFLILAYHFLISL